MSVCTYMHWVTSTIFITVCIVFIIVMMMIMIIMIIIMIVIVIIAIIGIIIIILLLLLLPLFCVLIVVHLFLALVMLPMPEGFIEPAVLGRSMIASHDSSCFFFLFLSFWLVLESLHSSRKSLKPWNYFVSVEQSLFFFYSRLLILSKLFSFSFFMNIPSVREMKTKQENCIVVIYLVAYKIRRNIYVQTHRF